MEFKKINSLGITECCNLLGISRQDLSESLVLVRTNEVDKSRKLVIEHLTVLLEDDKRDFEDCKTIETCKRYLEKWPDGLWRYEVLKILSRLKDEREDSNFYNKSRRTIADCRAYLKKYPNGQFSSEAKRILQKKMQRRRTLRLSLAMVLTIIGVIVVLWMEGSCGDAFDSEAGLDSTDIVSGSDAEADTFSHVVPRMSKAQYGRNELLLALQNRYDEVERKEGTGDFVFYRCKIGDKYEILDSEANVLIPKTDFSISYFEKAEVFAGRKDEIWVIYSKSGDMVIPATRGYTGWHTERVDDKRFYHVVSREDGTLGVCDKDGNVIIEPAAYDDVGYISATDDDDIDISTFYYRYRHSSERIPCYIYLDENNYSQHYPKPITHHLYVSDRIYVKKDGDVVQLPMGRQSVLVYDDSIIVDLFIYHYWGTIDGEKYFRRGDASYYFDEYDNLIWETEEFRRMWQKDETL